MFYISNLVVHLPILRIQYIRLIQSDGAFLLGLFWTIACKLNPIIHWARGKSNPAIWCHHCIKFYIGKYGIGLEFESYFGS